MLGGMLASMTVKKWSDIRAQRFTAEELRQIDQEVEREICAVINGRNGRRIKLAEG
jgi:hypothetical protein